MPRTPVQPANGAVSAGDYVKRVQVIDPSSGQIATRVQFIDSLGNVISGGGVFSLAATLVGGTGTAADNLSRLNAGIAASPVGSIVVFPPGITQVNGTIILKPQRRYISHYHGSTIQQAAGANLSVPLLASEGWVNNATTTDNPVWIEGIGIDGNKSNNSGTSVGLMLMSWESVVRSCLVQNTSSHGIQITDANSAAGLLTNTQVENRIDQCKVIGAAGYGIWATDLTSGTVKANTDGFVTNCIVGNPGIDGIRVDRSAGWVISGNHVYNVQQQGIYGQNGWGTRITDNYVEGGFGQGTGTIPIIGGSFTTTPSGVAVDTISGSGSGAIVANNHVSMATDPANGNTFHYIRCNAAASALGLVYGNIVKAASAGVSHLGLRTQGSGAVEEYGNILSGFGAGKNYSLGATTATPLNLGHDLDLVTAGKGLRVAEGTNAKQGVSTLVAGTVTVSNTSVTASSRIFLTAQSLGTVTAPKTLAVTARTAGTSFTITSADNTDTSVVAWEIFEPG